MQAGIDRNIRSEKALELIMKGESLFISGKAGTGKTFLLKKMLVPELKEGRKHYAVVAPTGVAAKNAGGATMHSLLHIPLSPYLPGKKIPNLYALSVEEQKIVRMLDIIIIDEISMVRCDTLDAIDDILRHYRHNDNPFGGIQMVFFGDMLQLMPVAEEDEWEKLQKFYKSPYFFSSRVMERKPMKILELQKVYRQEGNDGFIRMLNRIRIGNVTEPLLEELNRRVNANFTLENNPDYLKLCALNKTAWGCNKRMLDSLSKREFEYTATKIGLFPPSEYPTDFYLKLKVGARVMFVRNESTGKYVNGTMGTVVRLDYASVDVRKDDDHSIIHVSETTWTFQRYHLNKLTNEIEVEKCGSFAQIPLKLAWAITIHKSQGLTFEKAIIDVSRAFTYGQVYVALSRCKNFHKMVLASKVSIKKIMVDPLVINYIKTVQKVEVEDSGEESVSASRTNKKIAGRERTLWMIKDGLSLSGIAEETGNRIELIYKDAEVLLENRLIDIFDVMSEERFTEIINQIDGFIDDCSLQQLKAKCHNDVRYGEIGLILAYHRAGDIHEVTELTPKTSISQSKEETYKSIHRLPTQEKRKTERTSKEQTKKLRDDKERRIARYTTQKKPVSISNDEHIEIQVNESLFNRIEEGCLTVFKKGIVNYEIALLFTKNADSAFINRRNMAYCPFVAKDILYVTFVYGSQKVIKRIGCVSFTPARETNGKGTWVINLEIK